MQAVGFAPAIAFVPENADQSIDVVIEKGHTLSAKIVDTSGRPISDARISANMRTPALKRIYGDHIIDGDVYRSIHESIQSDEKANSA